MNKPTNTKQRTQESKRSPLAADQKVVRQEAVPSGHGAIVTTVPNLDKWSLADVVNPKNFTLLDHPAATQRLLTDNGAPSIGGHNS